MFHQPHNTNSLRDTGHNTMHMVFEGELALKLHVKDVDDILDLKFDSKLTLLVCFYKGVHTLLVCYSLAAP